MKQTEIGMIPDDWEVKELGELGSFKGGGTPNTQIKKYWDGDIPWISSSDILKNDIHTLKPTRFITKDAIKNSATQLCPQNSILIVSRVGVGKLVITKSEVCTSQDFSNLICNDVNQGYIAYLLSEIMQRKANEAQGTSIKGITTNEVKEIKIPLPPTLAEQQKIAKALSDVDNVISTLEKLITKKKNLKQGTMQQLLTGKKRLPGFAKSNKFKQTEIGGIPEDWEVKSFEELFEMKAGGDVDKNHFSNSKSHIYKYKIFSNGLENEGIYGYTNLPKYKGNAITITGRGTVGVAMYRKDDFDAVIRLLVLNSKDLNISDNRFIAEQINSYIKFPNESTGVPQLTVPQVKSLNVYLPSKLEQTAIANVLSSMDKEIEALNIKLEKYRNLKTGMMQQLLTGKIRM